MKLRRRCQLVVHIAYARASRRPKRLHYVREQLRQKPSLDGMYLLCFLFWSFRWSNPKFFVDKGLIVRYQKNLC